MNFRITQNKKTAVSAREADIDRVVCQIYDLTESEIAMEGSDDK